MLFSRPTIEKAPAAGLGVSVMTQDRQLGVPGCVLSTNHEVFRKEYWVSQEILRSIVARHTMLSVAGEPVRDPLRSLPAIQYFLTIYLSISNKIISGIPSPVGLCTLFRPTL